MLGHGEGQLLRGKGSHRRAAAWTGVLRNLDAGISHPSVLLSQMEKTCGRIPVGDQLLDAASVPSISSAGRWG